jgi:hypothetical protein
MTTGIFVPVAKQREPDRSPASAVEVKNTWNYAFTSPYVFMTWLRHYATKRKVSGSRLEEVDFF